jgi:hypothetical protein
MRLVRPRNKTEIIAVRRYVTIMIKESESSFSLAYRKVFTMTIATIARVAKIAAAGVVGGVVGHDGVIITIAGVKHHKVNKMTKKLMKDFDWTSPTNELDADLLRETVIKGVEVRSLINSLFVVKAMNAFGYCPFEKGDNEAREFAREYGIEI